MVEDTNKEAATKGQGKINLDEEDIKKIGESTFLNNTEDVKNKKVNTDNTKTENGGSQEVNEIEFILFLILILLLVGNKGNFDSYFNVFENEVNKVMQLLNTFSATEDGLKNILSA